VNADSIDIFIDLVQANIPSTSINLNFIFNQIYQNNLPPPIKHYFIDVYLFCLHKDPLDKSILRPLGIPTAIRRLMASHAAHTFHEKFAHHMLPFNYVLGTPNGTNLIINTMQLQVEKYTSLPQSTDTLPFRAAVIFDLTNQFNTVSREAFFKVIADSFSEIPPLTTLVYEQAGTVHHKWADGTWRTLLMEEGISQSCPHSHPFLPRLLSQTSSSHSTSNYTKEPPLTFKMVTQVMMASEALPIFLVTSSTSPHVSPLQIYNSSVTDLPPLGLHWDASSTQ
jgi:hypothetical protein